MRKYIIIVAVFVVIGLALYFSFYAKDSDQTSDNESSDKNVNNEVMVGDPDPIFAQPLVYKTLSQTFVSADFSFKHPEGFKATPTAIGSPEEGEIDGQVITVENSDGSGFQIFSMPWDEPGPITPERIWEDEPEADIIDPKNADLDGSEALVFYGYNGDIGETFEVWTVHNKKLYQITGPKTAEQLIIETLETWEWK